MIVLQTIAQTTIQMTKWNIEKVFFFFVRTHKKTGIILWSVWKKLSLFKTFTKHSIYSSVITLWSCEYLALMCISNVLFDMKSVPMKNELTSGWVLTTENVTFIETFWLNKSKVERVFVVTFETTYESHFSNRNNSISLLIHVHYKSNYRLNDYHQQQFSSSLHHMYGKLTTNCAMAFFFVLSFFIRLKCNF